MNGLEVINERIKNFICEKEQVQKEITGIENRRIRLAQERNEKKKFNGNNTEVNELGRQISELGNQSQGLQNKLDFKFHEVKTQIGLIIDNSIAEGIRGIRKINEEIQGLECKIANQKERNAKYQLQKQEFYVRFGRMPELSENALQEIKRREQECKLSASRIEELGIQIKMIEDEITLLAKSKREFENGNWNTIIENESIAETEEISVEPLSIEEIETVEEISINQDCTVEEMYIEQFEPIEEIYVEEIEPIEEMHIEEFEPIEELKIEEFAPIEDFQVEEKNVEIIEEIGEKAEQNAVDEIEELAKAIVEEIVAEQTRNANINRIEEQNVSENIMDILGEDTAEDIITFEEETENKEKVIIPLFGQKATISNITIKIEDKELVYKAQMSDGKEVKIYPSKLGEESVLLRDKQNRAECEEILINYAVSEYKIFDKKVISKIDPLVCELLIECAERYNYDAQELVYNYAISFSYNEENDTGLVPAIVYNLSYIEASNLSRKEKAIINKICKNARKNNKIDIIESFSGFKKIKYVFKRLFAVNNVKVLPEAKY